MKPIPTDTPRLIDDYCSGLPLREVGLRHGMSLQSVWRRLKQARIPRRPQGTYDHASQRRAA